jgi:hypothetical protein
VVKVVSSTTAWALACFAIAGFMKRVKRCLLSEVVILHILQLVVVVVKHWVAVLKLRQSKKLDSF